MATSDDPEGEPCVAGVTARPGRPRQPSTQVVFIATHDRTGVERIARRLEGIAVVRQVVDARALDALLRRTRTRMPHIVIDCCVPAIDPVLFARRLAALPSGSKVLLWGATAQVLEEIAREAPAASGWLSCPADATHEEVARVVGDAI